MHIMCIARYQYLMYTLQCYNVSMSDFLLNWGHRLSSGFLLLRGSNAVVFMFELFQDSEQ